MAGKYDDMSFKKAFAAARKAQGAGKVFTWKGKRYTTNLKEEEKKLKASKGTKRESGAVTKSLRPKKRISSKKPVKRPSSVKRVTKAPDKSTPSFRNRKTTTVKKTTKKDLNKIANIASKAIDNDPGVMTQAEKLERKLANLENKAAKAKLGGGTVPNSVKTEMRSLQRSLAKLTPRLSDDIKVGLLSGIDSIKVLIDPGRLFPKKKPKKKVKK